MQLLATDRKIVIVGLGVTGLSCARHLAAKGVPFVLMDTRDAPAGLEELRTIAPEAPVLLGELDVEVLRDADEIWLSPGVPLSHPAIAAVQGEVQVRGDVDVFSELVEAPVIAITGSNGKSTVTTLLGEMARHAGVRVAVGGNLGTPVLDLLDSDVELYVVELSSFQLETTRKLGAKAATVLNLSQDHLDRYPSMAAYHLAKMRIFFGCERMVLNKRDTLAQPPVMQGAKVFWFSLERPEPGHYGILEESGSHYLAKGHEKLYPVDQMKLKGQHNWSNALAALALAEAAGIPLAPCLEVLGEYNGLPHRCEWIADKNGVTYINDSKATNVGAAIAALSGLAPVTSGRVALIAGGQGKDQDFSPLAEALAQLESQLEGIFLIGEDAALLKKVLPGRAIQCASLDEAVQKATDAVKSDGLVLLAPACASFDMYRSYAARGEHFRELVEAL